MQRKRLTGLAAAAILAAMLVQAASSSGSEPDSRPAWPEFHGPGRLNISLEVTDLESSTDFRPTTLKRTIDTTVLVKDGNTIVIGGLIDNTVSNIDYQVPCLGGIPGLGWLFRSHSRTGGKTNLYVFLTPRVIQSPEEAEAVYNKKRNQIDAIEKGSVKMYPDRAVPPEEVTSDQDAE